MVIRKTVVAEKHKYCSCANINHCVATLWNQQKRDAKDAFVSDIVVVMNECYLSIVKATMVSIEAYISVSVITTFTSQSTCRKLISRWNGDFRRSRSLERGLNGKPILASSFVEKLLHREANLANMNIEKKNPLFMLWSSLRFCKDGLSQFSDQWEKWNLFFSENLSICPNFNESWWHW